MHTVGVLLALGATARLTRLVTSDVITERLRLRVVNAGRHRVGLSDKILHFITCPWCVSMWIAAPVAVAFLWAGGSYWFLAPALVLTLSHVTGLFASLERD